MSSNSSEVRDLIRAVHAIVSDTEAMKAAGGTFGPFSEGRVDYRDGEAFYVEWPNLEIAIQTLRAALRGVEGDL